MIRFSADCLHKEEYHGIPKEGIFASENDLAYFYQTNKL